MTYRAFIPYCIVLLFASLAVASLHAQQDVVSLTNGRVTALLDPHSGRFAARTSDGRSLLFSGPMGLTSHISVAVGSAIYTNYPKSQMQAPWPQRNLGRGSVEKLADRLRYTWEVPSNGGVLRIIQELEPVSDSLFEEVRIHLIVENATGEELDVGMTVMEDLDADGDDHVLLRDTGTLLQRETGYRGDDIPERLLLHSAAYAPDSAGCRVRGAELSTPHTAIVGRWTYHGFLGTAVYGYTSTDQPITDSGVLLQWDTGSLRAGRQRHETTAVGYLPKAEVRRQPTGTFAYKLIVPMQTSSGILSIVSDATTRATVRAPFVDAYYESSAARDGSWDTTLTVTPLSPASVYLPPSQLSRLKTDSISYYQQEYLTIEADRKVGAFFRHRQVGQAFDGRTVWPVTWWDSLYLFHGLMNKVESTVQGDSTPFGLSVKNTIEYDFFFWSPWFGPDRQFYAPVGGCIEIDFPACGHVRFDQKSYHLSFNSWDPTPPSERDISATGTGDMIRSTSPVSIPFAQHGTVFPGKEHVFDWVSDGTPHVLRHPSRCQLGREYAVIPFRKQKARVQDDLLRIIAYEDDTEVTIIDGTAALRLDRSDYVDTLIAEPAIIRSNNPVAVFQHHLSWMYLESDTSLAGGGFTLLPPSLWGNRYHSVTNDVYQPNVASLYRCGGLPILPVFNNLYLIIVTRAKHRSGILVNGNPVHPASFTVFGEYAYTYYDISPGYHLVTGEHPLLVVTCGGGYHPPLERAHFGMSYIPPFTGPIPEPLLQETEEKESRHGEESTR